MIRSPTPVRPLARVPRTLWLLLVLALTLQIATDAVAPAALARYRALGHAPNINLVRLVALGERELASRALMLILQSHDTQPGLNVPFARLDYERVLSWMESALRLDPNSHYPLLAAVRIYAAVPDPARRRMMLDFVHRSFLRDPDRRWRWLAEAAILAKHRQRDLNLALAYASDLTQHARGPGVPAWARDMTVIVLEEMGELEAARLLIGGLIDNGRVTDRNELRFLDRKLRELESAQQ